MRAGLLASSYDHRIAVVMVTLTPSQAERSPAARRLPSEPDSEPEATSPGLSPIPSRGVTCVTASAVRGHANGPQVWHKKAPEPCEWGRDFSVSPREFRFRLFPFPFLSTLGL